MSSLGDFNITRLSRLAPNFLIFQLMSQHTESANENNLCSFSNACSPYTDHISRSISPDSILLLSFSLNDVKGISIGTTSSIKKSKFSWGTHKINTLAHVWTKLSLSSRSKIIVNTLRTRLFSIIRVNKV